MTLEELLQDLIDDSTQLAFIRGIGWFRIENTGYMVPLPHDYIQGELLNRFFKSENELYKSYELTHSKITSAEKLFQVYKSRDADYMGTFFFANQNADGQPHMSRITLPLKHGLDVSRCADWIADVYPQNPTLLQQVGGYCLFSPDNRFQKIFLITGSGANGKGTFLRILTTILEQYVEGEKLATPIDLDEFGMHERLELIGKQLVYDADISGSNKSLRWLKIISGGDKITARGLYKSQVKFLPTCKIMLLSNPIPSWENSPALTRRLILMQFKKKYKIDPGFELGLLSKDMLEKWICYFKQGYDDLCKRNTFALIDENNAQEFLSLADDVALFLQDQCDYDPHVWIPCETFHRAFIEFWRADLDERKAPPNRRVIGKRLREYGIEKERNRTLSDEELKRFALNAPVQEELFEIPLRDGQQQAQEQKRRWDCYQGITLKKFRAEEGYIEKEGHTLRQA